ncbi:unnamed protein product [Rhodiola kirilowii]
MTSPPTLDQDQNVDAVDLDAETVDSNGTMSDTPGGTRYWTPQCLEDQSAFIGQKFDSLNSAITFYNGYAWVCGFSVRLGTGKMSKDGTVRLTVPTSTV